MKNLFKILGLMLAMTMFFACSKSEAQHQEFKSLTEMKVSPPSLNDIKAAQANPTDTSKAPYSAKPYKRYGRPKGDMTQTYP